MRIPPPLIAHLRQRFALDWNGIHGVSHWSRAARVGERLAEETGARLDLGRVGIFPDPDRLGTAVAKRREVIEWAYAWSVGGRRSMTRTKR